MFKYIDSLRIKDEKPNEEALDSNNLMFQYQNEVIDVAGEFFGNFLTDKGIQPISRESVDFFVDLHRILVRNGKAHRIVVIMLKQELKEYLKTHQNEYVGLRDKLDHDNAMQIFLDDVVSKMK